MQPREVLRDIALGESPRWHEGRLWFCDWVAREIVAVDEQGTREVMVETRQRSRSASTGCRTVAC